MTAKCPYLIGHNCLVVWSHKLCFAELDLIYIHTDIYIHQYIHTYIYICIQSQTILTIYTVTRQLDSRHPIHISIIGVSVLYSATLQISIAESDVVIMTVNVVIIIIYERNISIACGGVNIV